MSNATNTSTNTSILTINVPTTSGTWFLKGTPSQIYTWLVFNSCNGYYMQEPHVKWALFKATGFEYTMIGSMDPEEFGLKIEYGWVASW